MATDSPYRLVRAALPPVAVPDARPVPAGGRRPRRRSAARACRSGYGQDHHAGRGGRRAGPPRCVAGPGAGADLQPQGRRRAARADRRPARAYGERAVGVDVPRLVPRPRGRLRRGRLLPRLLSGPERLVRIRELLSGAAEGEGSTRWPDRLAPALADPRHGARGRRPARPGPRARPRAVGRGRGRRARAAVTTGSPPRRSSRSTSRCSARREEMDYAELVRRALLLLADPVILAEVRAPLHRGVRRRVPRHRPGAGAAAAAARRRAAATWSSSATPTSRSTPSAAPTSSCILRFPERFRTTAGAEAPTLTLGVSRRAGAGLLAVSRAVAERIPAPGWRSTGCVPHRALTPVAAGGTAEIRLFGTVSDEAVAIADVLRRAHLEDGLDWSSHGGARPVGRADDPGAAPVVGGRRGPGRGRR